MRMPSYILITLGVLMASLFSFALWYSLNVAWHGLFLRAKITTGVWVVQRPLRIAYDLVDNDGKLLVPAVDGWILREDQLYGSYGERGYFAIALPNTHVQLFEDMRHLNRYLSDLDFPWYNMGDEESAVDIKYSQGRQRRYVPGN